VNLNLNLASIPPTEWFNRPVQKDVAAQRRAA